MPNVYPMQPLGEVEDSEELLTYVARDPIEVEDPAALPTDWSGWNEGAEWTGRVDGSFTKEHDAYGLHRTLKVAKGIFLAVFGPDIGGVGVPGALVRPESYLQNTTGGVLRGSSAFTVSWLSAGRYQVDLLGGYQLPTLNARILPFADGFLNPRNLALNAATDGSFHQTIRVESVPLVTRLVIRVYVNDTLSDPEDVFGFGIHDS